MNKLHCPDFWHPEPGSYELSEEGWELWQQQQGEEMESLRSNYPELSHWGDLERLNAWSDFCFDFEMTMWSDPYRTDYFLEYLKLAQAGNLPDCSKDSEAIRDHLLK